MSSKTSVYERSILEQQKLFERAEVLFPLETLWNDLRPMLGKTAKTFVFMGQGSSLHVARWGADFFSTLGLSARVHSSMEVLQGLKHKAPGFKDIVPIMISQRGNEDFSKLVMDFFPRGILLKAVESPGKTGFLNLSVSSREVSRAYTFSVMASLLYVWFLGRCVSASSNKAWLNSFRAQRKALKDNIAPHFRKLQTSEIPRILKAIPFLTPWSTFHLISPPSLMPIAQEIGLKLQETAYIPALVHGVEDFLHGPLCSIEPGNHVLFLNDLSADPILQERFKQAQAFCHTLKTALISGPRIALGEEFHLKNTLANLLFGQSLALEYSLQRGTNPDTNRRDDALFEKAFHKIHSPISRARS